MAVSRPKIVVVDGHTLNPGDLSWSKLKSLGDVSIYEHSTASEILDRCQEADIILSNKAILDQSIIQQLPKLKCICVLATGYNNIDLQAASARNMKSGRPVPRRTTSGSSPPIAGDRKTTSSSVFRSPTS